eukprot:scaffold1332_cov198-Chaetoceros_neogracile.AAC.6
MDCNNNYTKLRGALSGSARNKIERAMSVLNLPLAHMSVRRQDMPKWAEKELKKRALKLKDLCIYCGSGADDEEDDDTFLLRLPQLQERLMTDGYVCFPMCITCVNNGKKVVKAGKKDTAQARVERIARLGN